MYPTQKPLSALDSPTELAPTQANFPALKHFFPIDETLGDTITDSVGGVVITPTSAPTFSGGKADDITTGAADALTSGSWAPAGTKSILLMLLSTRAATHDVILGTAGVDSSIRTRNVTASIFVGASGVVAESSFFAGTGTDEILTYALNSLSTTKGLNILTTSETTHTLIRAGQNGTSAGLMNSFADKITLTGHTDVYGMAIFHFDTYPDDIEQAAFWMQAEWAKGNKVIYPGWKNKS